MCSWAGRAQEGASGITDRSFNTYLLRAYSLLSFCPPPFLCLFISVWYVGQYNLRRWPSKDRVSAGQEKMNSSSSILRNWVGIKHGRAPASKAVQPREMQSQHNLSLCFPENQEESRGPREASNRACAFLSWCPQEHQANGTLKNHLNLGAICASSCNSKLS